MRCNLATVIGRDLTGNSRGISPLLPGLVFKAGGYRVRNLKRSQLTPFRVISHLLVTNQKRLFTFPFIPPLVRDEGEGEG
jgi:hypothetical protein